MNNANDTSNDVFLQSAIDVIDIEAEALLALKPRLDQKFVDACKLLMACEGRIVVTGIGKSGHIGNKMAATFASTGSPAFFVHAAEASHGDLGMLKQSDVVLAISYSGSSDEILTLLPGIKRLGIALISLCSGSNSPLAKAADINLDISVEKEACPLGLAPTASTTCTLALGDALAVSLLHARGFSEDDFAMSHPGGRLGRRLLLRVGDIMHAETDTPMIDKQALLPQALLEMTSKGLGMVTIIDADQKLLGVFTDGDLRRTIDEQNDLRSQRIQDVMTTGGRTTTTDTLAINAIALMQRHRITALPVVNEAERITGIISMHALLGAGVV
ncbi:MAG: KpsF/GutQ family sugar-phosphate isomerase [Granulosicoccaceae bacterium]